MKNILLAILIILTPGVALAGKSRIVEISQDTYLLVKQNYAGIFGNLSKTKIEAIQDASEFAAKQGKIAVPLSVREFSAGPGQFPKIEYQFRVVEKDDPEAGRISLDPVADVVVTIDQPKNTQSNKDARDEKSNIYDELIKLDDLRKRGIISEDEFIKLKAEILNR